MNSPVQEQTNVELQALGAKLDESQASIASLSQQLESLVERQTDWQPEFELIQAELRKIKSEQKALEASKKTEGDPEQPEQSIPEEPDSGKMALGRVEWLWLVEAERYFASQLDTGLALSLVYAGSPMVFERDGERWLRFSIERNNWSSTVEARVKGSEKVSSLGGNQIKGHVVSLPVQLGSFSGELEFLVIEKTKKYPQFILGKNFLTDIAIVDVSEKYLKQKNPEYVRTESERREAHEQAQKSAQNTTKDNGEAVPRVEKASGS